MDKRYFDVWFGIDYVVCAKGSEHVMDVLAQADHDFKDTLADFGEPVIEMISELEATRRTFWDDGVRKPLDQLELGEWVSSEF